MLVLILFCYYFDLFYFGCYLDKPTQEIVDLSTWNSVEDEKYEKVYF